MVKPISQEIAVSLSRDEVRVIVFALGRMTDDDHTKAGYADLIDIGSDVHAFFVDYLDRLGFPN